jgi:hypothetical protein
MVDLFSCVGGLAEGVTHRFYRAWLLAMVGYASLTHPTNSLRAPLRFRVSATGLIDVRLGLFSTPSNTISPDNGIFIEYIASTDANWYTVTKNATVQTRYDSTVAASTNWVKIETRRVDSSNIVFSVNDGADINVSAALSATLLLPVMQVTTRENVSKYIEVDVFDLKASSIAR